MCCPSTIRVVAVVVVKRVAVRVLVAVESDVLVVVDVCVHVVDDVRVVPLVVVALVPVMPQDMGHDICTKGLCVVASHCALSLLTKSITQMRVG